MIPKRPAIVVELFSEERAELVGLLASLTPDHWQAPTL